MAAISAAAAGAAAAAVVAAAGGGGGGGGGGEGAFAGAKARGIEKVSGGGCCFRTGATALPKKEEAIGEGEKAAAEAERELFPFPPPSAVAVVKLPQPEAGRRTTAVAGAAAAAGSLLTSLLLKGTALFAAATEVGGVGSSSIGFGAEAAGGRDESKPFPLSSPPPPPSPPPPSSSPSSSPSPSLSAASLSSPLRSLSHLLSPSLAASTTSLEYLETMQGDPPPPTADRSAAASNDSGELAESAALFAIFAISPLGSTAPVDSSSSLALASLQSARDRKTSLAAPGARSPPTVAARASALRREKRSTSYRDRQSCLEASNADESSEEPLPSPPLQLPSPFFAASSCFSLSATCSNQCVSSRAYASAALGSGLTRQSAVCHFLSAASPSISPYRAPSPRGLPTSPAATPVSNRLLTKRPKSRWSQAMSWRAPCATLATRGSANSGASSEPAQPRIAGESASTTASSARVLSWIRHVKPWNEWKECASRSKASSRTPEASQRETRRDSAAGVSTKAKGVEESGGGGGGRGLARPPPRSGSSCHGCTQVSREERRRSRGW